jgi:hypothetical protein
VTAQRLIELRGICTVVITVSPGESAQANPPRALSPVGFKPGHSLSEANDPALQKGIIMDALELVQHPELPGTIVNRDYDRR